MFVAQSILDKQKFELLFNHSRLISSHAQVVVFCSRRLAVCVSCGACLQHLKHWGPTELHTYRGESLIHSRPRLRVISRRLPINTNRPEHEVYKYGYTEVMHTHTFCLPATMYTNTICFRVHCRHSITAILPLREVVALACATGGAVAISRQPGRCFRFVSLVLCDDYI